MSETKRPRGRPPKFPPHEVRDRLIESGIRSLQEQGLDVGLDAVGLDAAIAHAKVPRGMSYRIWQDSDLSPQNALRHAVVTRLLSLPATTGLESTKERLAEQLEFLSADIASPDTGTRMEAILELVRSVGGYNHMILDESEEWRLYNALRASAITRSTPESQEILDLLGKGEEIIIAAYAELYTDLAKVAGLELRPEYTIEQFSAAAYALNEGLSARLSTSYKRRGIARENADGTSQDWTLFSIGLEALIRQFFTW